MRVTLVLLLSYQVHLLDLLVDFFLPHVKGFLAFSKLGLHLLSHPLFYQPHLESLTSVRASIIASSRAGVRTAATSRPIYRVHFGAELRVEELLFSAHSIVNLTWGFYSHI